MNIRVDLNMPIKDGIEVVFRSPVDCSKITGLKVYYPGEGGGTTSQEFAFADAHGNNVGDIDHLFAENAVVKVILDVTTSMAFVQNADTNAYLEGRLAEAVTHTPKTLTDEQKAQARKNIGAASQTEADFFHSRLDDGSLVLTDTKTGDDDILYVHKGELKLRESGVTFLTDKDEHRIAEGAKARAVLYTQQELTEEQKAQARENIGAVSVDIVVQKDKEASVSSLKINHSPETSDSIFLEGSVVDDKDSMVVNALTLRGDFGGSIDDGAVIIRNIHAGEDPADAATIGQVVRIDQPQNLSEEQKAQARENIGITGTGKDGKDGKTPVYGEDYFTEVDKAEMVSAVISALPKYNGEVVTE